MKRIRVVSLAVVGVFFVAASTMSVHAQGPGVPFPLPPVGIGLRVPLAGFVAVEALDGVRVEASAAFPGFSAPLVDFEGRAAVKLFPRGWEREVAGLPLRPFVGGGMVLLQAVEKWVPGWVLLAGAETPAPQWELAPPLTLEVEGSLTLLPGASAPTIVFQVSLGASVSFPVPVPQP